MFSRYEFFSDLKRAKAYEKFFTNVLFATGSKCFLLWRKNREKIKLPRGSVEVLAGIAGLEPAKCKSQSLVP